MTDSQRTEFPAFTEHRVQRDRGNLYIRDFPGSGAAFVLLHGFPDNSHIYDDLIPHLASARRRTISIRLPRLRVLRQTGWRALQL